jgi:hypothetical protein
MCTGIEFALGLGKIADGVMVKAIARGCARPGLLGMAERHGARALTNR